MRGSNTPTSVWDFVPIVQDVRSINQGIEDAEDGKALGAIANIGLGLGGMVLNTIGAGALVRTFTKEGGKMAVKEAGKQATKTGVAQVVKGGVRMTVVAAKLLQFGES